MPPPVLLALLTGLVPDGLPLAGPVSYPEYVSAASLSLEVCPQWLSPPFSLISLVALDRPASSLGFKFNDYLF